MILLLISFLLVPFGCSKKADDKNTLRVAIRTGPITLDPRIAADAVGDKISQLVCDGLMKKDENLEAVPNLAASYEMLSDTSYRFKLRPNVKFHNCDPLTAEDVAFTYQSIIDGSVISAYRSAFERIKEMTVEDPLTLKIDLKEPYSPFITMLTRGIVSKKAVKEMGDAFAMAPVGTGPYKFVRFVPDSVVELAANENYFGEKPKTKKLRFEIIKDDNIRVLKIIKGDIDLEQNEIAPMLLEEVLKKPTLAKKEDTGIVMTYMGFNLTDPVLSKQKVREAFAYAVDRDQIISHKMKGLAVKANSILAPGNWAYDSDLPQYEYDPEKAKKLLDAAGLPDPDGDGPKMRFEVVYKTSTAKDRIDIAHMISHQLAKVGIGARVVPHEWGKFYSDVKRGNFQIYTLSWVGITEPDIFYDVCNSSQFPPVGLNRDRYKNAKVDKLTELGRVTMDRQKRKEIYAKVQKILFKDLPYLPLWYEKNVVVYNKDLQGVELRADATYRTLVGVEK